MTCVDARRRPVPAPLRALWAPATWRATTRALAGGVLGLFGGALLATMLLLWWAAVDSLVDGPTGALWLAVVYVATAVAAPVPLLWYVLGLGALQRARFAAAGLVIPAPAGSVGRFIGGWTAASTWRQLAYHVFAASAGTVGGALVAAAWLAPLLALAAGVGWWSVGWVVAVLAAPWIARGAAGADAAAGQALLGPGRAEQLARRVESLARSRDELVAAADAERRRIERDLHDGAQQRLVSLALNLGMARARLGDAAGPAGEAIEQAHEEAIAALTELREFVRGLHPAVLNDRGLDAALSGIVARAPLPVRLRVDVAPPVSPSIEAIAYFTVSEALTNVVRHANAHQVEVTVVRDTGRLRVIVRDDGRGGAALLGSGPGTGLRGLAQRAAAVDGTLTVDSPVGGPTVLTVELPCAS